MENFPDAELTDSIIGAFYTSYNRLRFGFLESVYSRALELELRKLGLRVQREVATGILYDGVRIGWYRIDLLVESRIVIEIKATEVLPSHSRRQLLNGIHATRLQLGLLLHYGPTAHVYRVVSTDERIHK